MSGLNDNFLLADDSLEPKAAPAVTVDAFKDAEGEPELRDDLDLIAVGTEALEALEVQLRDLQLLQASIAEHQGMNQSIALEADALMPGFLNDDRPVAFFTKHPSKTMLAVANEEIGDQKKGILAKIRDFIVAMYQKVVAWFKALIEKFRSKGLASGENVKLLQGAKQEIDETDKLLLGYEKETHAVIGAAKERAAVLARQAQEAAAQASHDAQTTAAAKQKAENVGKLLAVVNAMRGDEFFENEVVTYLNLMLSKLEFVKKFLGEPDIVQPLMASHEDSIVNVNILLGNLQRAVARKDYEGVEKAVEADEFSKIAAAADAHAKALIQFKGLNGDYKAASWTEFKGVASSPKLLTAFVYGREMLEADMKDQENLLGKMDELMQSLYRMELYTPDQQKEAQVKASLDALKNFNKQVIVPATQRIAFSYSVIAQLVGFLAGLKHLREGIQRMVAGKLRAKVLDEARNIGMEQAEAEAILG